MEKKIHILSYGGGVNSSALFFYLIKQKRTLDLLIFSDTGEESNTTYITVGKMQKICKKKGIEFVIVKSKYGNMYDYYYKNKAVMSIMRRDCTSKFKISPIRQYIRKTYGKKQKFVMYIGISSDEWHRIKDSNVKYITHSYPFVEDKIDREGNIEILEQNNFSASKSGCVGCMFNKKKEWVRMIKYNPLEFRRWRDLESNNSRYPQILLNGKYSLTILERATKEQTSLLTFYDNDKTCDAINGGCFL